VESFAIIHLRSVYLLAAHWHVVDPSISFWRYVLYFAVAFFFVFLGAFTGVRL